MPNHTAFKHQSFVPGTPGYSMFPGQVGNPVTPAAPAAPGGPSTAAPLPGGEEWQPKAGAQFSKEWEQQMFDSMAPKYREQIAQQFAGRGAHFGAQDRFETDRLNKLRTEISLQAQKGIETERAKVSSAERTKERDLGYPGSVPAETPGLVITPEVRADMSDPFRKFGQPTTAPSQYDAFRQGNSVSSNTANLETLASAQKLDQDRTAFNQSNRQNIIAAPPVQPPVQPPAPVQPASAVPPYMDNNAGWSGTIGSGGGIFKPEATAPAAPGATLPVPQTPTAQSTPATPGNTAIWKSKQLERDKKSNSKFFMTNR